MFSTKQLFLSNTPGPNLLLTDPFIINLWNASFIPEGRNVTIPYRSNSSMIVDWGDGSPIEYIQGTLPSHAFLNNFPFNFYKDVKIYAVDLYYNNLDASHKSLFNRRYPIIKQWGSPKWLDMTDAFKDLSNLTSIATDAPDITQLTTLTGVFANCINFTGDSGFANWNVSNITNIQSIFENSAFNTNINNWNVSNVNRFAYAFYRCSGFNQPLNNWNVSNGIFFNGMFESATNFNQPLNNWNVSNALNFENMFKLATSFNQPLTNWNTSKVTVMFGMFDQATGIIPNTVGFANWDMGQVTTIKNMFRAGTPQVLQVGNWNTQNLNNSSYFADGTGIVFGMENWNIQNLRENDGYQASGASSINNTYNTMLVYWANFVLNNNGPVNVRMIDKSGNFYNNSNQFDPPFTNGQLARNYLVSRGWTIAGDIFSPGA